jgi:hypothetical protein
MKWQILIEYDAKTGRVTTTAPMSHPQVALKMLASALTQMASEIEPPQEPAIVVPKLEIGRA